MLQTGYLTLDYEQPSGALSVYTLRFPNYEVEVSFTEQLSQAYPFPLKLDVPNAETTHGGGVR